MGSMGALLAARLGAGTFINRFENFGNINSPELFQ
jgi:hypothetical protein